MNLVDRSVQRLMHDYLEMPGLSLTLAQAQRLCGLDADECRAACTHLTQCGFLRLTDRGQYLRAGDGSGQWSAVGGRHGDSAISTTDH